MSSFGPQTRVVKVPFEVPPAALGQNFKVILDLEPEPEQMEAFKACAEWPGMMAKIHGQR